MLCFDNGQFKKKKSKLTQRIHIRYIV